MIRKAATVLALLGAIAVVASFLIPPDFAWNGLNTFNFCIATSGYASGCGAKLAWSGFAAALLYPYVWAVAAGTAAVMEWNGHSKVASYLPALVTTVGNCLISALGVMLLLMRENWPTASIQWGAAVASLTHIGIMWSILRRTSPERHTAVTLLVGATPFLLLQAALGVCSWRYASPVLGFALAGGGTIAILSASCILLFQRRGDRITLASKEENRD
jgi:hypothetical protein